MKIEKTVEFVYYTNLEIERRINELTLKTQDVATAKKNSGKTNGGEVYTPYWAVVEMANMNHDYIRAINTTVLDMCAGTGNFTIEIYRRKLITAFKRNNNLIEEITSCIKNIYAVELVTDSFLILKQRVRTYFSAVLDIAIEFNYIEISEKEQLMNSFDIITVNTLLSKDVATMHK